MDFDTLYNEPRFEFTPFMVIGSIHGDYIDEYNHLKQYLTDIHKYTSELTEEEIEHRESIRNSLFKTTQFKNPQLTSKYGDLFRETFIISLVGLLEKNINRISEAYKANTENRLSTYFIAKYIHPKN